MYLIMYYSCHDDYTTRYHESGPLFHIWILHYPMILALDPECIKVSYTSKFTLPREPEGSTS